MKLEDLKSHLKMRKKEFGLLFLGGLVLAFFSLWPCKKTEESTTGVKEEEGKVEEEQKKPAKEEEKVEEVEVKTPGGGKIKVPK